MGQEAVARRIILESDPFAGGVAVQAPPWKPQRLWPGNWVSCQDCSGPSSVAAFRRVFELEREAKIRLHVSADQRYDLFLDGQRIGRGSERGDRNTWFFESYELTLPAGRHALVVRTWTLAQPPWAQISVRPGVIVAAEEPYGRLLSTGVAAWEAKILGGYGFTPPVTSRGGELGSGANVIIDGQAFDWGFERGEGKGWRPVVVGDRGVADESMLPFGPTHILRPAMLPGLMEERREAGKVVYVSAGPATESAPQLAAEQDDLPQEHDQWQKLLNGQAIVIPPGTRRRVIIDLENYYCMYPGLTCSGGAGSQVHLQWAEALYVDGKNRKEQRDAVARRWFAGTGDLFKPDGGRERLFEPLWWRAGRFIELAVTTGEEPLEITRLELRETRYPLAVESSCQIPDPRLERIKPILLRALQECMHETYMDCPYYEQLMYIGDTRLQVLLTYVLSGDARLPRKTLRMMDASRCNSTGLPTCAYPDITSKIIPSFDLWYIGMVHDYAMWRGDKAFVAQLMPGVRFILDSFLGNRDQRGLVRSPGGWNYVDAVREWPGGVPTGGGPGQVSGPLNWLMVYALMKAVELEAYLGEGEMAARDRRLAGELAAATTRAFWDPRRGLLADDLAGSGFSEHAQCLAILSGCLDEGRRQTVAERLLEEQALARTSIFFSHYLFETLRLIGRAELIVDRLVPWLELPALGMKTTPEHWSPTVRSDCHAWGAHPLYHYFTSIVGIRPAGMGFESIEIWPQLGKLGGASAEMVHPRGKIRLELEASGRKLSGRIDLPPGVGGVLKHEGRMITLRGGENRVLV